jgi:hypothetical protein
MVSEKLWIEGVSVYTHRNFGCEDTKSIKLKDVLDETVIFNPKLHFIISENVWKVEYKRGNEQSKNHITSTDHHLYSEEEERLEEACW